MSPLQRMLVVAVALGLSLPAQAADRDKDGDGKKSAKRTEATSSQARRANSPTPGTCNTGTATRSLDINRVDAQVFNTGSLFYGGNAAAAYIVGGDTPIYASGIWVGGKVDGDLLVAGSRYNNFEFWPGPLGDDGSAPADCAVFDRIYKVSRQDFQDFEITGNASADFAEWPVQLGAPVIAAADNDFDDDGDGLTDEGTDEIDNDGDALIDELDEQERLDPARRAYDIAAGDRPDIIGDQSLWWVMNDVGNTHDETDSDPIGIEVRVQAFAFDAGGALGDITFYKYTIVYKGEDPLEEAYLSIFSDPDLGNAADDYVGVDTTRSLGYVYNADNFDDGHYGVAPPAAGYDFFQGPKVDTDGDGDVDEDDGRLGLTSFAYFINGGPPELSDPGVAEEYYNVMQGLAPNGNTITQNGNGVTGSGDPTIFAYAGDPVTGQFWSEVNSGAGANQAGDRRLVQSTGPFTIQPGDVQEIVYGLVYARGNTNISSITALRVADAIAQDAYDADFEVPRAPPAPPKCVVGNEVLAPGSGNCAEAVQLDEDVILTWGYPTTSSNFQAQFDELGYEFEGFNVYRYPTRQFIQAEAVRVATFDLVNDITVVNNRPFDPAAGDIVPTPAAFGSNSGLQYFYQVEDDLVNNQDYFYGITAYGVNLDAPVDLVLESSPTELTVRPTQTDILSAGTATNSDVQQFIPSVGIANIAFNTDVVGARVVNPLALTGDDYEIRYFNPVIADSTDEDGNPVTADVTTYSIVNATTGEVLLDGQAFFDRTGKRIEPGQSVYTADGLTFSTSGPDPGVLGIVEVVGPGGVDPCVINDDCNELQGEPIIQALNSTGEYFLSLTPGTNSLASAPNYAPNDFEIRFGASEASIAYHAFTTGRLNDVPFSVYDIGANGPGANDPSDDVRMVPVIFSDGGDTEASECVFDFDPTVTGDFGFNVADRIYGYYAADDNYDAFEAAAEAQIGGDADRCAIDDGSAGGLVDFGRGRPVQRETFADYLGGIGAGTVPIGTLLDGAIVRIITTKPNLPGDIYQISTADFAATRGDQASLESALDQIGAVPNPYRGSSIYERDTNDRLVRFVGMPEQATVRIYTVAGTLIRTLEKAGGGSTVDWDLTTENKLPVASGMYIVHVGARDAQGNDLGDRVIKLGVIQRETEITTF